MSNRRAVLALAVVVFVAALIAGTLHLHVNGQDCGGAFAARNDVVSTYGMTLDDITSGRPNGTTAAACAEAVDGRQTLVWTLAVPALLVAGFVLLTGRRRVQV